MVKFTPSKVSLALLSAGLMAVSAPMVAQAEDTKAENQQDSIEVIQVTGIRQSLAKSQALKMDSESIVEAVSAEDIGKLPDVSIAESLARLPGLAAQRVNGRGQVISIRGLAPDFTTATLNGRQQVSSGDNRSVEYDMYPSELLSGAVVYKTPDAALMSQAIGGTVDMQTIRPLGHGERALVANARYEWNQLDALNNDADNKGERFTLSYIDQFADNTLGVAIGFSHINTPTQGERFNAWGYPTVDGIGPWGVEGETAYVLGGAKPFVQSNTLERDSVMAVVEYVPNDRLSTTFDLFYSDFNEDQLLRGIELPLAWGAWGPDGGTRLAPGYTVENGVITSGTITNVQGVIRSDMEKRESDTIALGWNTEYVLNDRWTVEADVAYSKNEREDQVIENYSGYVGGADSISFTTGPTGTVFSNILDYSDASQIRVTNLQSWGGDFVPSSEGGQKGYYKQPASTDELTQLRLSAAADLDLELVNSVEFGVNYDRREKTKTTTPEFYFALPNHGSEAPIPSDTTLTDLGFLGLGHMVGYDPIAIFNSDTYDKIPGLRSDVVAKSWQVEEKILTGYVKFGVDGELAGLPVKGNFGVQVVNTDQSSTAMSARGSNSPLGNTLETVPVSGGKTYTEILPSLNLNFEVGELKYVRVGAARVLARPRMDEMRASSEFSLSTEAQKLVATDINDSPWSAGGGNPELDPWIANQFDLSYDQYLGDNMGYFSIAGFYKDLDSYIINSSVPMSFEGFPTGGLEPVQSMGLLSVPLNGDGGSIHGFEVSGSLSGELVSPALAGFGVVASASLTKSSIEPETTPESALPGLSEDVVNLTFYYENEGLSARVSGRYRSEYLGELAGFDARRVQRMVDAETIVDAQLSYTFDSGALDGLTVLLQGNNLTDEPFVTTENGDANRVIDYQRYGRTFALGVSYKM